MEVRVWEGSPSGCRLGQCERGLGGMSERGMSGLQYGTGAGADMPGTPDGGLWGSTALIAPDEPWGRLGLNKDTESVPAS